MFCLQLTAPQHFADQTRFRTRCSVLRLVIRFSVIFRIKSSVSRWYVDVAIEFQVLKSKTDVISRNFNVCLFKSSILSFCEGISHVYFKLIFSLNIIFFLKKTKQNISIPAIQHPLSLKSMYFSSFYPKNIIFMCLFTSSEPFYSE